MEIYRKRKNGSSKLLFVILLVVIALFVGGGVYFWQRSKLEADYKKLEEASKLSSVGKREAVQLMADKVLKAFKNRDLEGFAALIHPDKGVRFTPYSYVDLQKDIVIAAKDVAGQYSDTKKLLWGAYDGTGDPINMTFAEYYKKFIYDVDFFEAPHIIFNLSMQRGNSILNVKEAYPNASNIEYHFDGFDAQYNGMDWRSLRLVFEQKDNKWYLIGVIHEQWTI